MDASFIQAFVDRFNRDKKEFHKRFEDINNKLDSIDNRFRGFDDKLEVLDRKLEEIQEAQELLLSKLGVGDKLDNVKVYLSTIETRLNQYKTLSLQGEKLMNGELYLLKIRLQKIKPIINWENNELLAAKYRQIEESVSRLEEGCIS